MSRSADRARRTLEVTRDEWQDLAELDPLYAVLTHPGSRGGAWDVERFFATGESFVQRLIGRAAELGLPRQRRLALDFGCGVGRLTRALAGHFEHCIGIDVSPRMVELARSLNAHLPDCSFLVNQWPHLEAIASESCDLVLCKAVLQHLPGIELKRDYLVEMVRVCRPGGLVAVQVPGRLPLRRRLGVAPRLYAALRRLGVPPGVLYHHLGLTPIRMSAMPRAEVLAAVAEAGGSVRAVDRPAVDPGDETYYLTRP